MTGALDPAAALSALDCVLLGAKGVYASSELSTGRRVQRVQREHDVADASTVRERLGARRYDRLVWKPNAEAALAFALELRSALGPRELVISPAPFTASGWTQAAYLSFWEDVIRTRAHSVYFNDGWEYSNGCGFEFVVATEAGLDTFDRARRPLSPRDGADRMARAAAELESQGHDTAAIRSSLERLRHLAGGRP